MARAPPWLRRPVGSAKFYREHYRLPATDRRLHRAHGDVAAGPLFRREAPVPAAPNAPPRRSEPAAPAAIAVPLAPAQCGCPEHHPNRHLHPLICACGPDP
ncbi:hypothetical protein GCM10027570_19350 [Streptomonospora sediminis]